MSDKTPVQIHNEICEKFLDNEFTLDFIKATLDKEPDQNTLNVTVEKVVSGGRALIGFIDVLIEFMNDEGHKETALIEVKSSEAVIEKDKNAILRQIKKYNFYIPDIDHNFLIYPIDCKVGLPTDFKKLIKEKFDNLLFSESNIREIGIDISRRVPSYFSIVKSSAFKINTRLQTRELV